MTRSIRQAGAVRRNRQIVEKILSFCTFPHDREIFPQSYLAPSLDTLKIKLFFDGADIMAIADAVKVRPWIKGFTTNPTLARKAGISDYIAFIHQAIDAAGGLPISFEVLSDTFDEMEREARLIHRLGPNIYVKIPITNTGGASSAPLIGKLSREGIAVNVTAILTTAQVCGAVEALEPHTPAILSVFAGRIADTGMDPVPVMRQCRDLLTTRPKAELLWASPRELLNIFQADAAGCQIITVTKDVLAKVSLVGKDLTQLSLETVQMFFDDAVAAGYTLTDAEPG